MNTHTRSDSPRADRYAGHRLLRRAAVALAVAVVALALLATVAPGYFRLVVLQPARDMLFFNREIEPLRGVAEIERHRPRPDDTLVLPPSDSPHDIRLVVDVWAPAADTAPVALLLHGSSPRGRKLGFNMLLASRLREQGWLVLTPDTRGYRRARIDGDLRNPDVWRVENDLHRLADLARQHPNGNGTVVAVGHSHGGSLLIDAGFNSDAFAAIALIGPSRERAVDTSPTYWQRLRFASDRWLARPVTTRVMTERMRSYDIMRLGEVRTSASADVHVLVMDGEREGARLIGMLDEASALMPAPVTRATVEGSHHYCGAYQLPLMRYPVFVRPAVFERCSDVLFDFLAEAAPGVAPQTGASLPSQ